MLVSECAAEPHSHSRAPTTLTSLDTSRQASPSSPAFPPVWARHPPSIMNDHAPSKSSVNSEEHAYLLDEKFLSDAASESSRAEHHYDYSPSPTPSLLEMAPTSTMLPSVSHIRSLAARAALFLLPSLLTHRPHEPARLTPTSHLDGLRGVAAFVVFFCHYFYTSFTISEGWGSHDSNYHLFKLPFLRLFYAGPPMVAIFFVVSGYALSHKPLKLARARRWAEFSQTMSSLAFRRALRLFIPAIVSTFIIVILVRLGAYEWNRDFSHDSTYHWNVQEFAPDHKETLSEQLKDWAWVMFEFLHVWGWEKYGGSTIYDVHLWTIPVEFRASMVLFLMLTALARLRTGLRFLFLGLFAAFSYRCGRWEMVLFLVGMFYAELDLIRGLHTDAASSAASQAADELLPTSTEPEIPNLLSYVGTGSPRLPSLSPSAGGEQPSHSTYCARSSWLGSKLSNSCWALLATLSLYLLSQPDINSENTPGWRTLSSFIPVWFDEKYRFWQSVGASLFVFCVGRMPSLQRVFNSPPAQYLGKISYAIYVMHGPVLHTVGYSMERWAWSLTGTHTSLRFRAGFMLSSLGLIPTLLWVSDVFWRMVDAPVVRFAKWLESKCVRESKEEELKITRR